MQVFIFFVIASIGEVLSKIGPIIPAFEDNGLVLDCGKRFPRQTVDYRGNQEYPWLVKLLYNYPKITRCGGVLIAEEWVLSSAFCIRNDLLQAVMVGEYDTSDDWDCLIIEFNDVPQRILISKKFFNHRYDVGLINLNHGVRTNAYVNTICLPFMDDFLYPEVIGRVAGWSHLDSDKQLYNDQLKVTDVIVMNNTECERILNITIPPYEFCARSIERQLPCVAMPGGPFMEYWENEDEGRYYLSGILVREVNECNIKHPMIFLDIRYVRDWANNIIRPLTYRDAVKPPNYSIGLDPTSLNYFDLIDECGLSSDVTPVSNQSTTVGIGEHPWIARLVYATTISIYSSDEPVSLCGGALITTTYVLTAKHCIKPELTAVILGDYNLVLTAFCYEDVCADPPQKFLINRYIKHPTYDVAIVVLKETVQFTLYIRPICLPWNNTYLESNTGISLVAGWEAKEDLMSPMKYANLHTRLMTHTNKQLCQKQLNLTLKREQFCTGGHFDQGICKGVDGGPLMKYKMINGTRKFFVTGISSFGGTCNGHDPVGFVNTSSILRWLFNVMEPAK